MKPPYNFESVDKAKNDIYEIYKITINHGVSGYQDVKNQYGIEVAQEKAKVHWAEISHFFRCLATETANAEIKLTTGQDNPVVLVAVPREEGLRANKLNGLESKSKQ